MNGTLGDVQPGRRVPGFRTPSSGFPRAPLPGDVDETTVSATGVDASTTGVTTVGVDEEDRAIAQSVTVTADDSAVEFNVNVDGTPLFDTPQSPAADATEETFDAPRNEAVGVGDKTVEIEITTASTGTLDVSVDLLGEDND